MIKKYDRYFWGDEMIEATGLTAPISGALGTEHVFKAVRPRPGRNKDEIVIYSEKTLEESGFIKTIHKTHPLILEIGEELRANPDFGENLIELLQLDNQFSSDSEPCNG